MIGIKEGRVLDKTNQESDWNFRGFSFVSGMSQLGRLCFTIVTLCSFWGIFGLKDCVIIYGFLALKKNLEISHLPPPLWRGEEASKVPAVNFSSRKPPLMVQKKSKGARK